MFSRKPIQTNRRQRPRLVALEDRLAPANFVVSSVLDDGTVGTLRSAITQANVSPGPDTITFSSLFNSPKTITLNGNELLITGDLTITGPGSAGVPPILTIDGDALSRVIAVNNSAASVITAFLSGLIVQNGVVSFDNGAGLSIANETVTLDRVIVRNNRILGAGAGAGIAISGGSLTIRDSTVSGNNSIEDGGGVYLDNVAGLLLERSTVSGNTATVDGGGIHVYGDVGVAGLTIRNSTIADNSAGGSGGGIKLAEFDGMLLVQNSTLSANSAATASSEAGRGGGGISLTGTRQATPVIRIQSSIVSVNSAVNGTSDISVAATVSIDHSAIGSGNGFAYADPGNTNLPLGTSLNLGPLQGNGGLTATKALPFFSPAYNRGSNPVVPPLAVDQRGHARSQAGGIDIGAYEQDASVPVASGTFPNVTAAGGTSTLIQLTYSDALAPIDVSTLDSNDIRLTGPNGFNVLPTYGGAMIVNPQQVIAYYTIPAAGGTWDLSDNGTYSIAVQPSQVGNGVFAFVPSAVVGTFQVAIPAVFHVTNANDSGPGSLRDTITQANIAASEDTIDFDLGFFSSQRTISLASALPTIANPVSIIGPGAGLLTVARPAEATQQFRIFTISGSTQFNVLFSGMTVTGGLTGTSTTLGRAGGGIYVGNLQKATIMDSIITGNRAADADGGGIYVASGGGLTILDCTISSNFTFPASGSTTTSAFGGGIAVRDGSVYNMERCTVTGNASRSLGGGIWFLGTSTGAEFTILNSTITNNGAGANGGGICVNSGPVNLLIHSSIIAYNNCGGGAFQFSGGGGIVIRVSNATVGLLNSVVAHNTGLRADVYGPIRMQSSLIRDHNGATITDFGYNLAAGTDPLFDPAGLADNGGATRTVALQPTSPLIDAGQGPTPPSPYDQRGHGFARVVGVRSDIGAYERQGPRVVSTVVNAGAVQRSRVTSLTVTFEGPVSFAGAVADAFSLTRNGGGTVMFQATASLVGGKTVVTIDNFTGPTTQFSSLADGRYTLTALASQISDNGQLLNNGTNYTFGDAQGLFRLYGDLNADRRIDIADFGFFSAAYLTPANFNPALDFNNDGRIDIADFGQFSVRFFTTLP